MQIEFCFLMKERYNKMENRGYIFKVDDVKKAGLDVPEITQLFYELSQEGYIDYDKSILTVEDGIKAFKKILYS